MRLLVLSNVNVAPIVDRVPGHEVEVGDYADVVRALIDPSSRAHADDVDVVAVLLDGDVLVSAGDLHHDVAAAIDEFAGARPETLVVVGTVRCSAGSPCSR